MSFLTKDKPTTKIGTIIRVAEGALKDKFVMIAKEYPKKADDPKYHGGYGVLVDSADWPS